MKSTYVTDLRPNQDVTAIFLVQSKEIRQKKSGDPYLSLALADRTGEIDAKMWDNVQEVLATFERDDFVKVKGRVQVYQNKPQLTVHRMLRVDDGEIDFTDYFAASSRDPDQMLAELRAVIAGMENPHLKALLEALFDDEEIAGRYRRAPAAKSIHHAYLGGLIEHVLSLCHLCRLTAEHYSFIDRDLLLAGAILHDIGKIHELSYRRGFGYTDDGQLLGHIVMGLRLIDEKVRRLPEFPARLRTLLEHMVISHHGSLEFGSPKVPLFPEALLLHYLDNLDSKMENLRASIAGDQQMEGCWTGYNRALDRYILKKDNYLAESGSAGSEAPAAVEPAHPESKPRAPREQPSLFGERLEQALRREP